MTPTLRQLQHLVLLADEGHFGRAAERAHVTQSALSRSLQSLETALGLRLLDRHSRQLRLTAVGERLLARARTLLSGAADLSREMALLRSGDAGEVVVGVGAFSGLTLLPPALALLYARHPSVRVRLDQNRWAVLLESLRQGTLDFFLAHTGEIAPDEALLIEPLGGLEGAFYCRPQHPLASRRGLRLADLAGQRFASVRLPPEIQQRLAALMGSGADAAHGAATGTGSEAFAVVLESENVSLLAQVAMASDIVLLACDQVLGLELQARGLVALELPELAAAAPPMADFGLIRLRGRTPSPASAALMDAIHGEARRLLMPTRARPRRARRRPA